MVKRFFVWVATWCFNTIVFGSLCLLLYLKLNKGLSQGWLNATAVLLALYCYVWHPFETLLLGLYSVMIASDIEKHKREQDPIKRIAASVAEVMCGKSREKVVKDLYDREKRIKDAAVKEYRLFHGLQRKLLVFYCTLFYIGLLVLLTANGYIKTTVLLVVTEVVWFGVNGACKAVTAKAKDYVGTLPLEQIDPRTAPTPTMTITDANGGRTVVEARRVVR